MALANLIAKAEAHYTKFETRKTSRLTQRAEKLALTDDERKALLGFELLVAQERAKAADGTGSEKAVEAVIKSQEANKRKFTKAERAAKKAEKAIRTREIKVMRRKARIAAVRYYLSSHTISETVTMPDGTTTETKVEAPPEVQEGVEDWQRLITKAGGVFSYPTRLFKRMWDWAKKPIRDDIPKWRRPSRIVRIAATAVAIAVLAVPVYVVTGILAIVNFLAYGVLSLVLVISAGVLGVVWLIGQALGMIPVVGRYLQTAVNVLVAVVGGLVAAAVVLTAVAVFAVNYAVHAALTGILMVIGSPVHAINWLHTKALVWKLRRGVKNGNIEVIEINTDDWVAAPTAEPVAEEVIDLREPVAEPVEEPVLEGVIVDPPAAPKQSSKRPRKARPVKPNVAVA